MQEIVKASKILLFFQNQKQTFIIILIMIYSLMKKTATKFSTTRIVWSNII